MVVAKWEVAEAAWVGSVMVPGGMVVAEEKVVVDLVAALGEVAPEAMPWETRSLGAVIWEDLTLAVAEVLVDLRKNVLDSWAEAVAVFVAWAAGPSRRVWAGAVDKKLPRSLYGCAGPPHPVERHLYMVYVCQPQERKSE
jgi:hypothetical protein